MKVTYSGKTKEFTPEIESKVEAKLSKLSKMIEHKGEKTAQVLHRQERHLHKVEIKTNFYDHALVGKSAEADLMVALCEAIQKLEKQIVNLRKRQHDTGVKDGRFHKETAAVAVEREESPLEVTAAKAKLNGTGIAKAAKPKVFRVVPDGDAKPMTLEEAMLEIDGEDYIVYRDLSNSAISVLLRRPDGNFDLVEGC